MTQTTKIAAADLEPGARVVINDATFLVENVQPAATEGQLEVRLQRETNTQTRRRFVTAAHEFDLAEPINVPEPTLPVYRLTLDDGSDPQTFEVAAADEQAAYAEAHKQLAVRLEVEQEMTGGYTLGEPIELVKP